MIVITTVVGFVIVNMIAVIALALNVNNNREEIILLPFFNFYEECKVYY